MYPNIQDTAAGKKIAAVSGTDNCRESVDYSTSANIWLQYLQNIATENIDNINFFFFFFFAEFPIRHIMINDLAESYSEAKIIIAIK